MSSSAKGGSNGSLERAATSADAGNGQSGTLDQDQDLKGVINRFWAAQQGHGMQRFIQMAGEIRGKFATCGGFLGNIREAVLWVFSLKIFFNTIFLAREK